MGGQPVTLEEGLGLVSRGLGPPLRVAVMADVALYRHALTTSISGEALLVGTATCVEELLALVGEHHPAVVVVDVGSGEVLGSLHAVRAAAPAVKLVAFAVDDREETLVQCAQAGVAGFVSRDATPAQLMLVIASAARGELVCSPRTAAILFERLGDLCRNREASAAAGDVPLTAREHEICSLLAKGLANKEIAVALRIEVATVKNHVHRILAKLRVTSRREAAVQLRGLLHS